VITIISYQPHKNGQMLFVLALLCTYKHQPSVAISIIFKTIFSYYWLHFYLTIPVEGPVLQGQAYKTMNQRSIHGPKVSGSLVIDERVSGSAREVIGKPGSERNLL